MRLTKIIGVVVAMMGVGIWAAGCSSSSDCGDGATCTSDAATTDSGKDGAGLFGLSPGTYCYDIVSIGSGANDGCDIGVANLVNMASLPGTYVAGTGTFTLGTDGSLGAGDIRSNMGTLTRDNMPSLDTMPTCMWHQTDTTMIVLTDTNKFTASVVENESEFVAACTMKPASGMCTSTWTWTMQINGAKTAPDCK